MLIVNDGQIVRGKGIHPFYFDMKWPELFRALIGWTVVKEEFPKSRGSDDLTLTLSKGKFIFELSFFDKFDKFHMPDEAPLSAIATASAFFPPHRPIRMTTLAQASQFLGVTFAFEELCGEGGAYSGGEMYTLYTNDKLGYLDSILIQSPLLHD
jgi:hypothetical protein